MRCDYWLGADMRASSESAPSQRIVLPAPSAASQCSVQQAFKLPAKSLQTLTPGF